MSFKLSNFSQIIVIPLVLLVVSCAQRETDIGMDAITSVPDQDFVILKGYATHSAEWIPELSNGLGSSLQIGNDEGFFAFSVMRWKPASLLPDSVQIDEVELHFSTARIWPDLLGEGEVVPDLRVLIREITEEWEETGLVPGIFENRDDFPIIDTILIEAVADDTLFYDLPDSLWQKWIAEQRADTSEDTLINVITSYGLLLEPLNDGVLIELRSSEGGGLDSDTGYTAPVIRITGTRWDLVDGEYEESELHEAQEAVEDGYLTINSQEASPGRINISAGYPQRGLFYFPTDSLEQYTERLIARAEFKLWADDEDPSTMQYNGTFPNFISGSLENSAWITEPDSVQDVRLRFVGTTSVGIDSLNRVVTCNVTGIVAGWLASPGTNAGLQMQTSGENQFLRRQAFHNHESEDESKRPQLIIWYVEPSN